VRRRQLRAATTTAQRSARCGARAMSGAGRMAGVRCPSSARLGMAHLVSAPSFRLPRLDQGHRHLRWKPPRQGAAAAPSAVRRDRLCVAASASASASRGAPAGSWAQRWQDWWVVNSPQSESEGDTKPRMGALLRKIWSLLSPDKYLLIGAGSFMVVAALSELAIPHFFTKSIFAAGVVQEQGTATLSEHIKILVGVVAVFAVTSAARGWCFSILNNRLTMRLRERLFTNLVMRETAFFDTTEVASLTSRLQTDCHAITKCIATNVNVTIRNALQAIGGFVYLSTMSRELSVATFCSMFILWGITLVYGNFARRCQKVYQDVLACTNRVADEVLSLSRIVRTFGTGAAERRRYSTWLQWLYQISLRQAGGYASFLVSSYVTSYGTKVIALVFGCSMIAQGKMTAEQLTGFILYLQFVVSSSLTVCDEFTEIMEAVGASERVMSLLDSQPAAQAGQGSLPPRFGGRLELSNVEFRYPSRPHVAALDGVTISLAPGTTVALVGRSGSGKSSAVALMQRLYDPTSGAVTLDGHDLRSIDSDWFCHRIGVVTQDTRLFGASIAANIAYGYRSSAPEADMVPSQSNVFHELSLRTQLPVLASQEEIEDAARAASAHDFIMALPQGYQTMVNDKLLSGGQKQRIALARALIRKPDILILDGTETAWTAACMPHAAAFSIPSQLTCAMHFACGIYPMRRSHERFGL